MRLVGDSSSYQKMIEEAVSTTKVAGKQLENETMKLGRMNTHLTAVGATTKQNMQTVSNQAHTLGYTISHLGDSMGNLVGQMRAMATLESPFGMMKEGIHLAAEAERNSVAFGVMLQDMKKGVQLEQEIIKLAADTPLQAPGIQQATKILLQFNAANEQTVLPTIRMLGDTAGGSQERLMSMALAFGQMSATGRLMGQDLLQMINAGFNPLQEISRTTGKSVSELHEEMEKGRITVGMVKEAFKTATSEGGRFKDGMQQASKTFEGVTSTMYDNIGAVKRAIGQTVIEELNLKEAIVEVGKAAEASSKFLNGINPTMKTLAAVVFVGIGGFGSLIVAWRVMSITGGMVIGTLKGVWASTKAATAATLEYIAAVRAASTIQTYNAATMTTTSSANATRAGAVGAASTLGKGVGVAAALYGMQAAIDQLPMHQTRLKGYKDSVDEVTRAHREMTDALVKGIAASAELSSGLGGGRTGLGRAALEEELRQRTQLMGQESGTTRSSTELEDAKKELANYRASTMAFLSHMVFTETAVEAKIKEAEAAVVGATERYEAEAKRIQQIKDELSKPPDQNPEVLKTLKQTTEALEHQIITLEMTADAVKLYDLKHLGASDAQIASIKALQEMNKTIRDEKTAREEATKKVDEARESINHMRKTLQEEIETMGMSASQLEVYKVQMSGLNTVVSVHTLKLIEQKRVLLEHKDMMDAGKKVIEQYATPMEKYSKNVAELNRLSMAGAIDRATYDRAMQDASKSLLDAGDAAKEARVQVERLDAVLAGSAEAKSRIMAFKELVTPNRTLSQSDPYGSQMSLVQGGQSRLSQLTPGGRDPQEKILRDIREILKAQKAREVLVKPAGL